MMLSLFADNIVYTLNIDPLGGEPSGRALPEPPSDLADYQTERRGKNEVRAMLYALLADFDYLHYDARMRDTLGGVVRVNARYTLRHRATGEVLTGTKRFVCHVEGELLARVDEFQDAALVAAFRRLMVWRMQQQVTA